MFDKLNCACRISKYLCKYLQVSSWLGSLIGNGRFGGEISGDNKTCVEDLGLVQFI